ncbi:MAG: hypothetical protein HC802_15960 [Caldilineaceae bacterium]|nr:hypothetical protein [Caldilineaceae bacterium]
MGICQPLMDRLPFPAYLMDIQGYVWAWNKHVPRMLQLRPKRLDFLLRPARMTLYQGFFHPSFRIGELMENRELFLTHNIRVLRQDWERERCLEETWCQEALAYSFRHYPEFKKFWDLAENPPISEIPARPLTNLRFRSPSGTLEFRVAIEKMTRDDRFKVVYLMPADAATLEECARW